MSKSSLKYLTVVSGLTLLILSVPSHALRCGSKLVKEGMLEEQVTLICGEPVSVRSLGLVVRYYDPFEGRHGLMVSHYYRDYGVQREMLATEMLFNFGPHKLMRKLRFEGGRLVSIETAGYGYHEKSE